MKLDGSQLRDILDLLGAPKTPSAGNKKTVEDLETLLGKRLPEETRQFLMTPVLLEHPHADHPYVDSRDFECGLPDFDEFIAKMSDGHQARYAAAMHFMGLYPIGEQLQYGDFMFAMAVLEPHTDDRLGGVMYYDEREVGTWGATVSEFLMNAIHKFWEEADGAAEDVEQGEEVDTDELRDCFILEYDYKAKPPETAELGADIDEAWEPHWRSRLAQCSRWWVNSFLSDTFEAHELSQLPTPELWQEEAKRVATTHHDAMYWLLAHLLLDNTEELNDCLQLVKENPSTLVQAVAKHIDSTPNLGKRWDGTRKKVFDLVREAHASA